MTRASGDTDLHAFDPGEFDLSEFKHELSGLARLAARLTEQLHQMRPAGATGLATVAIRSQASELSVRFNGDGSPRPMQWHLPVGDWAEQAQARPGDWNQSLWRPGPGQRTRAVLWEQTYPRQTDPRALCQALEQALERDLRRGAAVAAQRGALALAQELSAGGSERAWIADRRTPWMQAASTDLAISRVWQSVLLIGALLISTATVQNSIPISLGSVLIVTLICTGAWTQVTPLRVAASDGPLSARLTPAASSLAYLLLIAAGQPSGRAGLLALGLSVMLSAVWSERWRRASDRTEALASVSWQWNGARFIDLTPLITGAAQLPGHPRHRARMAAFGLIHRTALICAGGSGFKISAFPAPPQSWPRTTGARITGARITGARITGAQLRRQTTRGGALVERASPLDTSGDAA